MKNQYFGDQNDFFKYDLLIFLAEQLATKKLSFIWMRTENDRSNDGQKIDYGRGAGNRALFMLLKKALDDGARDVSRLNEYFKESIHGFEYCPYGSEEVFRHPDRESYFERIPAANLAASVIFLDPDIGLEAKSMRANEGEKYVTYEEVASIFSRMEETSVLVIYQHLPHVRRELFLYGTANRLMDSLKCPMPVSISDNQVAFITLAKTKKRQTEVRQALREYTRSHLTIFD